MRVDLALVTGRPQAALAAWHHGGRVVFVRYALPSEQVRAQRVYASGSYWHAGLSVVTLSPGRIGSLCFVAGPDGAG